MIEVFKPRDDDKGFVVSLIREANIVLESLQENSGYYDWHVNRFFETIRVARAIEATCPQSEEDIDFILRNINTLWKNGVLSPLTLEKDEFERPDEYGYARNRRYPNISIMAGEVYRNDAYRCVIESSYDLRSMLKIGNKVDNMGNNPVVYLAKGGVVTGDYIHNCIIREGVVSQHRYTLQSTVVIPVVAVYTNDTYCILITDHRNPKIKVLRDFYEVPVREDPYTKGMRIDIRKFNNKKD